MENESKFKLWNNPLTKRINTVRPMLLVGGLGLVVVLGGLVGMNPIIGVIGALTLLLLVVVVPRPILIVYALTLTLPLVGGLARGAVVPFLRVGQALVVIGSILFVLAKSSPQGKFRLTYVDLAFGLFFLTGSVFPMLALYYRGEYINPSTDIYGTSPLQILLGPILVFFTLPYCSSNCFV